MMQGERVDTRVSLCQSFLLPAFLGHTSTHSYLVYRLHLLLLLDLLDGHHLGVGGGVPGLDPHVVPPGDDLTGLVHQY